MFYTYLKTNEQQIFSIKTAQFRKVKTAQTNIHFLDKHI